MTSAELLIVAQGLIAELRIDTAANITTDGLTSARSKITERLNILHPGLTWSKRNHAASSALGIAINGERPKIGGKRSDSGRKPGQTPHEAIAAHRK